MKRSVLFVLACLALAGCTTSRHGTGTAVVTPSRTATQSAPPASAPPSTPTVAHPVDLSDVQPCNLFTAAVNAIADTDGGHAPLKAQLPSMPTAPACFQNSADSNLGMFIAASTNIDLNSFEQSKAADADVRRFTVKGYSAITIGPRSVQAVCFAGVAMADHQLLYLQYGLASPISTPKLPQQQLCARLRPIAQQVVSQLTH